MNIFKWFKNPMMKEAQEISRAKAREAELLHHAELHAKAKREWEANNYRLKSLDMCNLGQCNKAFYGTYEQFLQVREAGWAQQMARLQMQAQGSPSPYSNLNVSLSPLGAGIFGWIP
jgi:hypothetical protein